MAEALLFEFNDVTVDQYNAVNAALGTDPATGAGDWPAGLLSHSAGTSAGGGFMVFEVWDSRQTQEAWMASTLGPALGKIGVSEPSRVEWFAVCGHYSP